MATQQEVEQAKEFLKRAEIKTMKKDLLALREVDSLKERNKIANIKTLEEQQAEQAKKLAAAEAAKAGTEKIKRIEILQKNENQEYAAEKELKAYATEPERQQIFLFESQRVSLEKQTEEIVNKKDPALKLEKNQLMLQIANWQAKLNTIIEQEKKFEDEQKTIVQVGQTTTVASEKKSLEQRRWDLDKEIQDIEKKRWEIEKQIQDINAKIKEIDQMSLKLVEEKNNLRNKILGIDKSLREIYSVVIARVEEKRRGEASEQKAKREALEKMREAQNERVQRAQWSGKPQPEKGFLNNAPDGLKQKLEKNAQNEEEQRKKFLQDIELGTNKGAGQQQQKSNTNNIK